MAEPSANSNLLQWWQVNTTLISYATFTLLQYPSEEFLIYFATYYKMFGANNIQKNVTDLELQKTKQFKQKLQIYFY